MKVGIGFGRPMWTGFAVAVIKALLALVCYSELNQLPQDVMSTSYDVIK